MKRFLMILIILLLIIGGAINIYYLKEQHIPVVCSQEVKPCYDRYVSVRVVPLCEFQSCQVNYSKTSFNSTSTSSKNNF
ncbi:hypothetical protein COV23_01025 [Candidatus Wolfebacteria bacterium CG10_big_fil_rev_8_21_14_0_10_31_9]|uniref:Uncharacterized protein n=1 Tax=Candidatus Wolfebacteria bacterium CG10_big_fil_rev_8_21_14_0_10_31_9 TaxID=1975070 RepID=A0A2H0RCM3_9BACT|nr:MAG: hypothetical protein COV23_01025 [Candidatus Wolfebacteria bacterium CG10_big_fil_rev_8_21_14_0_10_31_9]